MSTGSEPTTPGYETLTSDERQLFAEIGELTGRGWAGTVTHDNLIDVAKICLRQLNQRMMSAALSVSRAQTDQARADYQEFVDRDREIEGRIIELLERVEAADEPVTESEELVYVTAYAVTRHYGGPEEGGWWYDWYEPIQTVPTTSEDADRIADGLRAKHSDNDQNGPQGRFSVLGNGSDLVVLVEDSPADCTTTTRPHYE